MSETVSVDIEKELRVLRNSVARLGERVTSLNAPRPSPTSRGGRTRR